MKAGVGFLSNCGQLPTNYITFVTQEFCLKPTGAIKRIEIGIGYELDINLLTQPHWTRGFDQTGLHA